MLDGKLGEVTDDVLHLAVVDIAVDTTEVIEPCDLVEEVVDDGDDNGNTNGVAPDDNDGDDVSPAIAALLPETVGARLLNVARQPSEDTEESSEDIDTEDGSNELEGWKGLSTTGDEDEPVLGECDFKEEHLLDGTKVLNDTTAWDEHGTTHDPGSESKEYTEDDGDEPDFG